MSVLYFSIQQASQVPRLPDALVKNTSHAKQCMTVSSFDPVSATLTERMKTETMMNPQTILTMVPQHAQFVALRPIQSDVIQPFWGLTPYQKYRRQGPTLPTRHLLISGEIYNAEHLRTQYDLSDIHLQSLCDLEVPLGLSWDNDPSFWEQCDGAFTGIMTEGIEPGLLNFRDVIVTVVRSVTGPSIYWSCNPLTITTCPTLLPSDVSELEPGCSMRISSSTTGYATHITKQKDDVIPMYIADEEACMSQLFNVITETVVKIALHGDPSILYVLLSGSFASSLLGAILTAKVNVPIVFLYGEQDSTAIYSCETLRKHWASAFPDGHRVFVHLSSCDLDHALDYAAKHYPHGVLLSGRGLSNLWAKRPINYGESHYVWSPFTVRYPFCDRRVRDVLAGLSEQQRQAYILYESAGIEDMYILKKSFLQDVSGLNLLPTTV